MKSSTMTDTDSNLLPRCHCWTNGPIRFTGFIHSEDIPDRRPTALHCTTPSSIAPSSINLFLIFFFFLAFFLFMIYYCLAFFIFLSRLGFSMFCHFVPLPVPSLPPPILSLGTLPWSGALQFHKVHLSQP
ncbi:hypothetical protein BDN70DRAFT_625949 [Pholiota conissans]|uniref:Uncharacterized protein n=1 Tax=Pholiota conissans TaxID=109636 RepID=A0A9P5YN71_9AGAR|nr:hypothetical protein BDN70DRAFT_625949 [Pholiota conissans]